MPRTFRATIAYDGTEYCGWQSQPGRRTIQGEIERVLARVLRQDIRAAASGRTDSGVHALGQVVSFDAETELSAETLCRALNGHLPNDIAVHAVEEMPLGFHATHDAVGKLYRYTLHDGPVRDVLRGRYVWHVEQRLDAAAMQQAGQALVGTHDFRSFESQWPNRRTSVRTVSRLEVLRGQGAESDLVTLEVYADGFLYNMVRAITGTLVAVGRGQKPVEWPRAALEALDRGKAGVTAPPQGLALVRVDFPPREALERAAEVRRGRAALEAE